MENEQENSEELKKAAQRVKKQLMDLLGISIEAIRIETVENEEELKKLLDSKEETSNRYFAPNPRPTTGSYKEVMEFTKTGENELFDHLNLTLGGKHFCIQYKRNEKTGHERVVVAPLLEKKLKGALEDAKKEEDYRLAQFVYSKILYIESQEKNKKS